MGNGKAKGQGKNSGANAIFTDIEDESPRNVAISTDPADAVSEENGPNFAEWEVLISTTILGRSEWRKNQRGGKPNNDCSCIIDTGFNGCALCSFNWMRRY